jgi:rhodanese-related sulfurtransferase
MTTIAPRELADRRAAGERIELIDVRTPVEFAEVHIDFARNVPLDQLRPDSVSGGHDGPIYLICRTGGRGRQACEKLEAAGLNAVNVEGGTTAWEAAGLPVIRSGATVMSLERQVRIGAGSLVVVGVALGALVHPAFYALAGFVGVGLVFAGVTDWCGMAMVLAKMPWNRVTPSPPGAACEIR